MAWFRSLWKRQSDAGAVGTSPVTTIDRVVVGHLRMRLGAAMALCAAIDAVMALSA